MCLQHEKPSIYCLRKYRSLDSVYIWSLVAKSTRNYVTQTIKRTSTARMTIITIQLVLHGNIVSVEKHFRTKIKTFHDGEESTLLREALISFKYYC